MSDQNKATVRRLYDEVWNLGELNALDELLAVGFVGHRSDRGDDIGPDAVKESVLALCAAFPDGKFEIEDMVSEGDRVAVRFTARASHKGEFRGIAATGRRIEVQGIAIYRISGGRIVERWEMMDRLGLLTQLDALPAMTHAAG